MNRRTFLAIGRDSAMTAGMISIIGCATYKPGSSEVIEASDSLVSQLQALVPELMQKANIPGCSLALIKQGRLHWRRGFGVKDAATQTPVDNDTLFEAASISKPVFAYVVMKLAERGIIELDMPLTRYSEKPFLAGDMRLDLITARRVLSHTTGFQDWRSSNEPLKIHFTPGGCSTTPNFLVPWTNC